MKGTIKVGTPVIINEMDRPCTRLVAIVNRINGDMVYATYLTDSTVMKKCSGKLAHATPVTDFGVKLIYKGVLVTGVQIGESMAKVQ